MQARRSYTDSQNCIHPITTNKAVRSGNIIMTTYEKIKSLESVITSMSDMYAGGRTGTDDRGIQMAREYEQQASQKINLILQEDIPNNLKELFNHAVDQFNYFRQMKYKSYVAANKESHAFDHEYSNTEAGAENTLRKRIGPDEKDLFFWTVFVHENGDEEKL